MVFQLIRKIRQVASDSILQKWLVGRMQRQYHSLAEFKPHHPPFLQHTLPLLPETPSWCIPPEELSDRLPEAAFSIPILAHQQTFDPNSPDAFFNQPAADIEAELSRHRFAWLPLTPKLDPALLKTLWHVWRDEFMDAEGWAWHPYTAAERAVNLLDAASRCGAPDTLDAFAQDIAAHAPKIARQLEYFGDHDTSNHLANNGRGLYRIGCVLDMPKSRQIGFDILSHEAERIILEGGSLREGSTHYHMLYVRNYMDVWLAAHRHGHTQEADHLKNISKRLLAVAKSIVLPGGLPLIGDISPDCPPSYLEGIETGTCQWTQTLNPEEQLLVKTLSQETSPATSEQLQGDGWIRADFGRWSMLTSAPSNGWPFMPGHAHQDIGSPEIHFDGQPLFVDPGRGAYGETGEAALYRSAAVHGGLRVDCQNPYPANKPYYNDVFRQTVAGPASSQISSNSVSVMHGGYQRLGIETIKRTWAFDNNNLSITDSIQGHGHHALERALVTPHEVKTKDDKVIINNTFIIHATDARPCIMPIKIWNAYGLSTQGSRIVFENAVSQSWTGTITIEASH
jgi:hypothetical protein